MNINNLVRQSTALVVPILPFYPCTGLHKCPRRAATFRPHIPRPYGVYGLSINGGGYQAISENMGGGFRVYSLRILSSVEVGYGNARKVNDATINNHSGHERSAQVRTFYKLGNGLYFGGGA